MNAKAVTDRTFKREVMESEIPVLVDFWAPWCQPCKTLAPMIEEIATKLRGKLKICRLNVDNSNKTALDYDIRALPTLLVFRGGKLAEELRIVGLPSRKELEALARSLLKG